MSVPRSVAEILADHVTLEVEGIDRMYLNVYVGPLQREGGVASFFRFHRGHQFASSVLMDPISKTFIAAMEAFARREGIPVVQFRKGQRKDDIAAAYLKKFGKSEGVLFKGAGEDAGVPHRAAAGRQDRSHLSVAGAVDGHGKSFLPVLRGPGLRSVLSLVQHLFPLQRQAVPERSRVRQTATGAEGNPFRGARQWGAVR